MPTVNEIMVERYGDDWRDGAPSHVFDIENNYRTDYRELLVVRGASTGNVFGYDETVDVANYRVLESNWEDFEAFDGRGPYSNVDVICLDVNAEGPEDLPDVLEALSDYPLLDDQVHWEVEHETIEEHWELYGEADLHDVIAENLGADSRLDLTDAAVEMINALVWWPDLIDFFPSIIDVSAVDFGEREVWEWIAPRVGRVVTLKSRYRADRVFDLRLNKLVEVAA